jgi:hypothetical protein
MHAEGSGRSQRIQWNLRFRLPLAFTAVDTRVVVVAAVPELGYDALKKGRRNRFVTFFTPYLRHKRWELHWLRTCCGILFRDGTNYYICLLGRQSVMVRPI